MSAMWLLPLTIIPRTFQLLKSLKVHLHVKNVRTEDICHKQFAIYFLMHTFCRITEPSMGY